MKKNYWEVEVKRIINYNKKLIRNREKDKKYYIKHKESIKEYKKKWWLGRKKINYIKYDEKFYKIYFVLFGDVHNDIISIKIKSITRNRTHYLIRKGKIKKELCCICGKVAQIHHNDYNNPYNITWLCKKHHIELHKLLKIIHNLFIYPHLHLT